MTVAKPKLLEARRLLLRHLDIHPGNDAADLDPAEVGINGGPAHVAAGTSYHLGRDQMKLSKRPYSVYESPRDRRGLNNNSSGMDIGEFQVTVNGKMFDLRHFSAWLVNLCRQGDPDTRDIREVIYSLDGRTVRRWDALGKRTTGDGTHRWHTHVSIFRDADGACMVRLVTRYLQHIGLLTGRDVEDMTPEQSKQLDDAVYVLAGKSFANPAGDGKVSLRDWAVWMTGAVKALASAVGGVDEATRTQLKTDLDALSAQVDAVPDAVVNELGVDSAEQIAARLRTVLGDKAAAVGAILAAG